MYLVLELPWQSARNKIYHKFDTVDSLQSKQYVFKHLHSYVIIAAKFLPSTLYGYQLGGAHMVSTPGFRCWYMTANSSFSAFASPYT